MPLGGNGRRQSQRQRDSDRGVQYLSLKYADRSAVAGLQPSVSGVGGSYDIAFAATLIGLYKTEVIRGLWPWRSLKAMKFTALEWIDRFNNRRMPELLGHSPRAEAEVKFF